MIDTIKIYTQIEKSTYDYMTKKSNVKSMVNRETGELFYEIIQDSLKGSYDSNFMVRMTSGIKYNFGDSYCIELEGSYHKMMLGHNAYDGFYDIKEICENLIILVEEKYEVKLPDLKKWFLQRVDITLTFDLEENTKVCRYINNLNLLSYPRRETKLYKDECLYVPGTVTTLKIYNKLLEFQKHDKDKLNKCGFNLFDFIFKIKGYVRFECEIKKQKLVSIYERNHISLELVNYEDLEKIWREEFMKLLKFKDNDKNMKKLNTKDEVKKLLYERFKSCKANRLYNFFISVISVGYEDMRNNMSSSSFYRNVSELKDIGVDFTQSSFDDVLKVDFNNVIDFNPFLAKEVV